MSAFLIHSARPTPEPMFRRGCRTLFSLLALSVLTISAACADITIKLEQKDGDKISDVAKVTARAESPDGIDKVEFRVDDELRYTDTSTPYVYEWDTIADKEGKHNLSITAFDSNGTTKRVTLALTVDNEIDLGAEVLGLKAQEALSAKDYTKALQYGRRATKADPDNVAGSRVIASVWGGRREWAKAIGALENAKGLDKSAPAMLELASYRMQRALLPDNAANFYTELVAADELRRKASKIGVAELTKKVQPEGSKPTVGTHAAIGDALIEAGRYREAVAEYSKATGADDTPTSAITRQALAYVLDDRPVEALGLMRSLVRLKKDDAPSRAVLGLALLRSQLFTEARNVVQRDITDQFPAALIVASYADAAKADATNKTLLKEAAAFAKDAVGLLPKAGDAQFALALASQDPRESQQAIANTLALAPFQSGPYLDYASRLLLTRRNDRFEQVLNLTDFVLKYEPENVNARLMQALLYLQQKRNADAGGLLNTLGRKDTDSPDILMALASYWDKNDKGAESSRLVVTARQKDAIEKFEWQLPDQPIELIVTLNRKRMYRTGFFLMPSTLFREKADAGTQ